MKDLKDVINENINEQQVNESFLSVGLTIIVSIILAKIGIKFLSGTFAVFKGIKEGVDKAKEYKDAILQLNELLEPYKDELLKTEYASKLYDEASLITIASMRNKGFNIVYVHLDEDIKSTISAEDYKKYRNIIQFMWEMDNPLS
jgi:hypothetical protein